MSVKYHSKGSAKQPLSCHCVVTKVGARVQLAKVKRHEKMHDRPTNTAKMQQNNFVLEP